MTSVTSVTSVISVPPVTSPLTPAPDAGRAGHGDPLSPPLTLPADLTSLQVRGKTLLPIVQGGMGIGISAHRLAGSVAREGAMGTIASIDLRHHHPDLLARSRGPNNTPLDSDALDTLNLIALDREVRQARDIANGRGMVAVNVMKAVAAHARYVRQACESGAQAIVMGAGLPIDLPELTAGFDVALIPILSDARGIQIILRKWMRKQRLPDAIVIEHPGRAGGHLGATDINEVDDARFNFATVLADTREVFEKLGLAPDSIPLIVAGGIHSPAELRECQALGAAAVQLGTPFAITTEGDAHPTFKQVLREATPEDIVTFVSVTGLPARAVRTPWLEKYLRNESRLRAKLSDGARACTTGLNCISVCGLRDGIEKFGHFCIDLHLAAALKGELNKGIFFRGKEALPAVMRGTAMRSVRELMAYLLASPSAFKADGNLSQAR